MSQGINFPETNRANGKNGHVKRIQKIKTRINDHVSRSADDNHQQKHCSGEVDFTKMSE